MTQLLKKKLPDLLAAGVLILLFVFGFLHYRAEKEPVTLSGDYAEYENGIVTMVLTDSTEEDPVSDGGWRGEQMLIAEVTTGQYAGESLQIYNYVGPLYGVPLQAGDPCTMVISTYADGSHTATVFEYNREKPLWIVIGLFVLVTILVGGKTGARSLAGLLLTILTIFCILFPALMQGAPTLPAVFIACAYVAAFSFVILSGLSKKTFCAFTGTVCGMGFAVLFAVFAQKILRISGLRLSSADALLQMRQTGTPIGLAGLLTAGVIISSLGAVMDVAMSLSSAIAEIHDANREMNVKALFVSGMNVGRDMVGTMTNTLILAFLGSSLVLILYLYSLSLNSHQLLASAYVSTEAVSGISASIGVILAVPLTALIAAYVYGKETHVIAKHK